MKKSVLLLATMLCSCSAAGAQSSSEMAVFLASEAVSVAESNAMKVNLVDDQEKTITVSLTTKEDETTLCSVDGEEKEYVRFSILEDPTVLLVPEEIAEGLAAKDLAEITYVGGELETPDKVVRAGVVRQARIVEPTEVEKISLYDLIPRSFEVVSVKATVIEGLPEKQIEINEGIEEFLAGMKDIEVCKNKIRDDFPWVDGMAYIELFSEEKNMGIVERDGMICVSNTFPLSLNMTGPQFPAMTEYLYEDAKDYQKLAEYIKAWMAER